MGSLLKASSVQTMSEPLVVEELGSDLSRVRESMQKDAQGELGVTWRADVRERRRDVRRRMRVGEVLAILLVWFGVGSGVGVGS